MRDHSFTMWMQGEVAVASCTLLELYEQLEKMKYIDGPKLEQEYMNRIGYYEETIIKAEMECELLQKKQKMIQVAINRREPIDEAAIDAELENVRRQMLEDAGGDTVPHAYPELSFESRELLQSIYKEIVQQFHPETHPELTEVHRELFVKAREAYRHQDLEALKLVHQMLCSTTESDVNFGVMLEFFFGVELGEVEDEDVQRTDYTLASAIYSTFQPTDEEAVLMEQRTRYQSLTKDLMQEAENLRREFPFNAEETLRDPVKFEAYKEKLAHRLQEANDACERRKKAIRAMIESVATYAE